MIHIPVLLQEVLQFLNPKQNENFIDATIGEGGHAKAILEKTAPGGILLGIDRDTQQIERAEKELSKFEKRMILVNDSFGNLDAIIRKLEKKLMWQGILFDLGWSQAHMEQSGRGFSVMRDEALDMRYSVRPTTYDQRLTTAKEIVNRWRQEEIERILREYGEERFARRIADEIIHARKKKPIETTFQLVDSIKKATPRWYHHRRIHPATKTFQALRITVNDEHTQIEKGLSAACSIVAKGGKILVISFHSGEDRIVKNVFKTCSESGLGKIQTKKPIRPLEREIKDNPPARSAKLRVFKGE